jgi:hypothetical protein
MKWLDKTDLWFFGGILAFFAALTYLVVPFLSTMQSQTLAFIILAILSSVMTIYILGWKFGAGVITGLTLIYMVHDVAWPPIMVTTIGVIPGLPNEAQLSSDIFLWNLLPTVLPGQLRYFLTFVLLPSIILLIASKFFGRKQVVERMV